MTNDTATLPSDVAASEAAGDDHVLSIRDLRVVPAANPDIEILRGIDLEIRKGEVHLIKDLMSKSTELGMQTLDQSLVQAYKDDLISKDDAIRYADSANEVRLMIKLDEGGDAETLAKGLEGVEVLGDEY